MKIDYKKDFGNVKVDGNLIECPSCSVMVRFIFLGEQSKTAFRGGKFTFSESKCPECGAVVANLPNL